MKAMNEKIKNIEERLKQLEIPHEFIPLPEELPLDIASHVAFHKITFQDAVPTIIYKTEKGLVAIQRRADTKFDIQKLKNFLNVKELVFASKEDLQDIGTDSGIVPLVGLSIPYIIDTKVLERKEIYGGSNNKRYALKLYAKDLVKINNARIGDFSEIEQKKRILTGDTPTGKLHLGHWVGTLENRVKLQDEYEEYIILADIHALANPSISNLDYTKIRGYTLQVLLDNISAGLNPDKVTFFVESEIPEIYELAALFSMYVSHNRALRNPTIKDEIKMKGLGDQFTLGFVNYPMYQAADILCVKGELVPVGQDQEAHLEQSREIADVFNKIAFGTLHKKIFPEPKALIGRVGKLIGTDGNPKMSKTLGNTIYLSETSEEVEKKVMKMYTDPNRIHPTTPGRIEGNPVFAYLDAFGQESEKEQISKYKDAYTKGQVGDVEVKKYLIKILNNFLDPIRKRRAEFDNEEKLLHLLKKGTQKARNETQQVLKEVKEALRLTF